MTPQEKEKIDICGEQISGQNPIIASEQTSSVTRKLNWRYLSFIIGLWGLISGGLYFGYQALSSALSYNAAHVELLELASKGSIFPIPIHLSQKAAYDPQPGGGGFQGAGDVVSGAKFWWGLRAYSAATRGTVAANICNVSDVACVDMSTDATTGNLVVTTVGGSDCTSVTCTVKKLYDQSGANNCAATNCDIVNNTIATRPTLSVNCIGSLPCVVLASGSFLASANAPAAPSAEPFSASAVAIRTGNTSGFNTIMFCGGGGGLVQALFNAGANAASIFNGGGTPTATANDNTTHALQWVWNGASSVISVDGTNSTVNKTGTGVCTSVSVGIGGLTGNQFVGKLHEGGFWSATFSGTDATNMSTNQHSYWGF